MYYDEGLTKNGNMTQRSVKVFELDPMLVFRGGPIWQVSQVAQERKGLGTRREILLRSGANVKYCEGSSHKNQECRKHGEACLVLLCDLLEGYTSIKGSTRVGAKYFCSEIAAGSVNIHLLLQATSNCTSRYFIAQYAEPHFCQITTRPCPFYMNVLVMVRYPTS